MNVKPLYHGLEDIAVAYLEGARRFPSEDNPHWTRFGELIEEQFHELISVHAIRGSYMDEPYPDAGTMVTAWQDDEIFLVSNVNHDHPQWEPPLNFKFRAVHDVYGHVAAYEQWGILPSFGWAGELAACAAHGRSLRPFQRHALFIECIAQTGTAIHFGEFPKQAVIEPSQFRQLLPDDTRMAYDNFIMDPTTALAR